MPCGRTAPLIGDCNVGAVALSVDPSAFELPLGGDGEVACDPHARENAVIPTTKPPRKTRSYIRQLSAVQINFAKP
jgi:hypothetical protein